MYVMSLDEFNKLKFHHILSSTPVRWFGIKNAKFKTDV